MEAGGCGGGHWAVVGGFGSWVGVVWAGTGSSIDVLRLLWVFYTPSLRVRARGCNVLVRKTKCRVSEAFG